jgi:hypothetical protein
LEKIENIIIKIMGGKSIRLQVIKHLDTIWSAIEIIPRVCFETLKVTKRGWRGKQQHGNKERSFRVW